MSDTLSSHTFTVEIRQSASDNNQAAIGQVCGGEKVCRQGLNFSLKVSFSFFTQLLSSLAVCSTDCNSMNSSEERMSKSVYCLCPCLSDYCVSLSLSSAPLSVSVWNNYKHFRGVWTTLRTIPLQCPDSQSHNPFHHRS